MAEIVKMPNTSQFSPQDSFNNLVLNLANQIAEKAIQAVQQQPEHDWLNQKELAKRLGCDGAYIRKMERIGLPYRPQGKNKMYLMADVYEVLQIMKVN